MWHRCIPVIHCSPVIWVEFIGQPIFAVAATSFAAAQRAALLAKIDYEELPAQLTVEDSLAAQSFVLPQHQLLLGDPDVQTLNLRRIN